MVNKTKRNIKVKKNKTRKKKHMVKMILKVKMEC